MIMLMHSDYPDFNFVQGTDIEPELLLDFWHRNEITITPTDTSEKIRSAALDYPQLFIVALRKTPSGPDLSPSVIAGTVWGTFDGRRGYIAHLAVEKGYRGRGLGRYLMNLAEMEFHKMGVYKIHLFVEARNHTVGDFYNRLGYIKREELTVYSKTL